MTDIEQQIELWTERAILPNEVLDTIRAFATEASKQKRLLAHALNEFMDNIPHGYRMQFYDMIAAEWNNITGEYVTGRTIRFWFHSVRTFTKAELQEYQPLTDAQLIEAVKLANDCQNGMTAQDVCEWCIREQINSVAEMRAYWLPVTGTPETVDTPAMSGILRWVNKLIPQTSPRYARVMELINELRELFAAEAEA